MWFRILVGALAIAAGLATLSAAHAQTPRSQDVFVSSSGTSWVVAPADGALVVPGELRIDVTGDAPVTDLRIGFGDALDSIGIVDAVAPAGLPHSARVRALFEYTIARYYQWAAPSDWTGHGYSPGRFFQFFGYGLCSDAAAAFGTLAVRAGYPVRIWNPGSPPQHVVAEVFYDGAWHMFDANWPAIYLMRDGETVAAVADLIADPSLVADAGPIHDALVDIYAGTPPDAFRELTENDLPSDDAIRWSLWAGDTVRFSPTPLGPHVDDNTWPTAPPPAYGSGILQLTLDAADERTHGRIVETRNVERRMEGTRWVWAPAAGDEPADLFVRVDVPYPLVTVDATVAVTRRAAADRVAVGAVRDAEDLTLVGSDWPSGLFTQSPAFVRGVNLATIDDDGMFPLLHASTSVDPAELTFRVTRRSPTPRVAATVFRRTGADYVAVEVSDDDVAWTRIWEPAADAVGYLDVDVPLPSDWPTYFVRLVLTSATAGGWGAGLSRVAITGVGVPLPPPSFVTSDEAWVNDDLVHHPIALSDVLTPRRGHTLHSYLVHIRLEGAPGSGPALTSLTLTNLFQTSRLSPARIVSGPNAYSVDFASSGAAGLELTHQWTEHSPSLPIPTAPTGLFPTAEDLLGPDEGLRLSWDAVPDALTYRVKVCLDAACASVLAPDLDTHVIDAMAAPEPTHRVSWTVPGSTRLVPSRTYYWAVRAVNHEGVAGPWGDVSSITREALFGLTVDGPAVRSVDLPWPTLTGTTTSAEVTTVRWYTDRGASGLAQGTGTWSFVFHPEAGQNRVTIEAVADSGQIDRAEVLVATSARRYLLAEGATGEFFDTVVTVANPYPLAAPFRLRLLADIGVIVDDVHVLAPWSTTSFDLDVLAEQRALALATEVVSERGVPLIVERIGTWGSDRPGAHASTAISSLSTQWFFAEGSQGFFDTYWLMVNPHPHAVTVTASFMLDGGGMVTEQHQVNPNSRLNLFAGHVVPLQGRSFAAAFAATDTVAIERAMYFPAGQPWTGGHASHGATEPATTWSFAEGATGTYFDTFLLLGNPGQTAADVTVRYLLSEGDVVVRDVHLPAQSRTTVWVDNDPALAVAEMSMVVTATQPIVAERAMYWPFHAGLWDDAHAVLGGQTPSTRWGIGEVRTGGASRHDTYLLIANSTDQDAALKVTFFADGESVVERTFMARAGRRFTISSALMVPELDNRVVGAVVETTNGVPIYVESTMYWDGADRPWAAGVGRRATRLAPEP